MFELVEADTMQRPSSSFACSFEKVSVGKLGSFVVARTRIGETECEWHVPTTQTAFEVTKTSRGDSARKSEGAE
jgi:hypothetical protein